jgi:hypothetical protein
MVIGESPRVSMLYVHSYFVKALLFLLLGWAGLGFWKVRGFWMPWGSFSASAR